MVLALARNGAMGLRGGLPWSIPEDLSHFRKITMGHTLIVGRKTASQLPPLPMRRLVVVSSVPCPDRFLPMVTSITSAIDLAHVTDSSPCVIGGAKIYQAAMPYVTRIHLTEIEREVEADTFFRLDRDGFRETGRARSTEPDVQFVILDRVTT